jgi:hypothetical protein
MQRLVSVILLRHFATGWTAGVQFPAGQGFPVRYNVHTGSGAHPAFCPVVTGVLSSGIKRPGRVANNSLPSCAEDRMRRAIRIHSHIFAWLGTSSPGTTLPFPYSDNLSNKDQYIFVIYYFVSNIKGTDRFPDLLRVGITINSQDKSLAYKRQLTFFYDHSFIICFNSLSCLL